MLGVGTETPDSFLLLSQHPVPSLISATLGRRQLPPRAPPELAAPSGLCQVLGANLGF